MRYEEELMEIGVQDERARIIALIEEMDNQHITHSEKCLKMHWFAEKVILKIKGETE